jgi:hypothetical protein
MMRTHLLSANRISVSSVPGGPEAYSRHAPRALVFEKSGRHPRSLVVEKAALAAGGLNLPGHSSPHRSRRATYQRAHIDDRKQG